MAMGRQAYREAVQHCSTGLALAHTVDHAYTQGLAHFFAAWSAQLRRDLSATEAQAKE
jgi:hypothetical protein